MRRSTALLALLCLTLAPTAQAGTETHVFDLYGSGTYNPGGVHGTPYPPPSFSSGAELYVVWNTDGYIQSTELTIDAYGPMATYGSSPVTVSGSSLHFSASGYDGSWSAGLGGDLGALNANGMPVSLAGVTSASVSASGPYHGWLVNFYGSTLSAVPEPAAWLLMALGVLAAAVVARRR
jgi:hypothetical protein